MNVPTLTGRVVRLEPLEERHREPLRPMAQDERIWTATLTHAIGPDFDVWFDDALRTGAAGTRTPFAVVRIEDGQALGSSSYLDIAPEHRRVEIGATWCHPSVWATAVNPESKLLLLTHAFDVLGCNRVALVTDALNHRSQAAIAKLGAARDGVLRSHMLVHDGRIRDTVVFSIVRAEWPAVRRGLLVRLGERTSP
jgi:RimJ/RimL family protein N-acetyltransferase